MRLSKKKMLILLINPFFYYHERRWFQNLSTPLIGILSFMAKWLNHNAID